MRSYYQHPHSPPIRNPNPIPSPNSVDPQPNPLTQTYASAPPFATSYASCDYSSCPSTFPPPYPHNPDPLHPLPPTDPCYYSANPSVHAFNPSPQLAPDQQRSYFPSYDPPQPLSVPITNPSPRLNPVPSYPSPPHLASYGRPGGSSVPPAYENLIENSLKFDNLDETIGGYGAYGRKWPGSGSDLRGKRLDDGVYAYDGRKVQPYGARGTSSKSSTWLGFDDYGRSISMPSWKEQGGLTGLPKIVRAIPKVEAQQDVKSGVQKFRVKLLPEGGGQSTMDVHCQAEVTHRLSNAKEATSKPAGFQSHEDLVRKLELEMERNRKTSSDSGSPKLVCRSKGKKCFACAGSNPDVSGRQMRDVTCPTCTVHLQVQVPSSGSETIECGVCQNPFLVGTH